MQLIRFRSGERELIKTLLNDSSLEVYPLEETGVQMKAVSYDLLVTLIMRRMAFANGSDMTPFDKDVEAYKEYLHCKDPLSHVCQIFAHTYPQLRDILQSDFHTLERFLVKVEKDEEALIMQTREEIAGAKVDTLMHKNDKLIVVFGSDHTTGLLSHWRKKKGIPRPHKLIHTWKRKYTVIVIK